MVIQRTKKGLSSVFVSPNRFDPSCFEDKVAENTDWRLMGDSGTRLLDAGKPTGRHRSHIVSPDRIELWVTPAGLAKPAIFIAIGIGLLIVGSPVSLLFGLPGLWIAGRRLPPKVVDKKSGLYWKGWRMPPPDAAENGRWPTWCRLQEVHAIQLLYGRIQDDSVYANVGARYVQYELNLVLHDARRVSVLAHDDIAQLREDGARLADLLQLPLWDATRHGMAPR